jgi:hypothetical protein
VPGAVGKFGAEKLAVSDADELDEPACPTYETVPVIGVPLARNVTVPPGATPELCVVTVAVAIRVPPTVALTLGKDKDVVVLAGVTETVADPELAI